jgi:glutaredoxin 3
MWRPFVRSLQKSEHPWDLSEVLFYSEKIMNFAIYTRTGCPYCTKIKQVLSAKNHSYTEYQLDVHFKREDFYKEFGQGSTFPQVLLDSKKIGGCTEAVKYLREQNLI